MFRIIFFSIFLLNAQYLSAQCKSLDANLVTNIIDFIDQQYAEIIVARNLAVNSRLDLQSTISAFDPVLSGQASSYLDSYYTGSANKLKLSKQNEFLGSRFDFGYKKSSGSLPIYEDIFDTSSGGEFFTSITIPLLRNLEIDKFRIDAELAKVKIDIAEIKIFEEQQNVYKEFYFYFNQAMKAQFNKNIIKNLLVNLEKQKKIIQEQIDAGTLPQNDLLEVERFILKNKSDQIKFDNIINKALNYINQVYLNKSGIYLSSCQLPQKIKKSKIVVPLQTNFLTNAIQNRPDLNIIKQAANIINKQLMFEKNQYLPNLNFKLEYENGLGTGHPSDTQDSVKGLFLFEYPIFNRRAESQIAIKNNELYNVNLKIQNLENILTSKVFNYYQDLETTEDQLEIFLKEIDLVAKLLDADYENYKLGNRDLFQINLRENLLLGLNIEATDLFFRIIEIQTEMMLFINNFQETIKVIDQNIL